MGSSASKAAKHYPKPTNTARVPWTTGRTSAPPPQTQSASKRGAEIDADAGDPQVAANLARLGVARVEHEHVQPVKPSARADQVVQSRIRVEQQETGIPAQALTDLLTEAKSLTNAAQLDALAAKYGVNADTFRDISRHFNTPSVSPATITTVLDDDGNKTEMAPALWLERKL
ncbi:hypothetical protein CYLTODRAFT_427312 [Cylindrobasidium torrendii FP15055 ss-10]|uniref:Uncharacterized protein n=1 Tax=Cylindrobasidium torrendii FP15055 ss-10 TaxID=1314674 RepID=A0A0D7AUF2_9AGAR|nr:hypothetical protein CYLTODRAFT_427312 [Cylindrobasidium torrendii FP15055 ss-10]